MSPTLSGPMASMQSLGAAWGLGTLGLAAAVALLVLLRRGPAQLLQGRALLTLAASTLILCVGTAVWPAAAFGDPALTWAAWVRGISGDLSATAVVLLLGALAAEMARRSGSQDAGPGADGIALRVVVAVFGWALILTQLLSDRIDLYSVGYEGAILPLACTVLGGLAALAGAWRCALSLAAALLAWGLGLMESSNLWDALVDPWLTVWASGSLVGLSVRALRRC